MTIRAWIFVFEDCCQPRFSGFAPGGPGTATSEKELGARIALHSCSFETMKGFVNILLDTPTFFIADAKIDLSTRVSLIGCFLEPLDSLNAVLLHTFAGVKAASN